MFFSFAALTTLRWRLIADHNEWPKPYTVIRRFPSLFDSSGMISLDRNYSEVTNLLYYFVSNALKTEKMLQFFETKEFSTCAAQGIEFPPNIKCAVF